MNRIATNGTGINKRIGRNSKFFLFGIIGASAWIVFSSGNLLVREKGNSFKRQPELQTIQLGDGWGYQIVMNGKVLIYQPTIPAIDTLMAFPDETSARMIGSIVLEKLNQNRDFTVTITDIQKSLSYFYK